MRVVNNLESLVEGSGIIIGREWYIQCWNIVYLKLYYEVVSLLSQPHNNPEGWIILSFILK